MKVFRHNANVLIYQTEMQKHVCGMLGPYGADYKQSIFLCDAM